MGNLTLLCSQMSCFMVKIAHFKAASCSRPIGAKTSVLIFMDFNGKQCCCFSLYNKICKKNKRKLCPSRDLTIGPRKRETSALSTDRMR